MRSFLLIITLFCSLNLHAAADEKALSNLLTEVEKTSAERWPLKQLNSRIGEFEKMVDEKIKNPKSLSMASLLKVAVVLSQKDKTAYIGEILLPLSKKQKQEFQAALKTLPQETQDSINDDLSAARSEE